jgi:hypothetical protein
VRLRLELQSQKQERVDGGGEKKKWMEGIDSAELKRQKVVLLLQSILQASIAQ